MTWKNDSFSLQRYQKHEIWSIFRAAVTELKEVFWSAPSSLNMQNLSSHEYHLDERSYFLGTCLLTGQIYFTYNGELDRTLIGEQK